MPLSKEDKLRAFALFNQFKDDLQSNGGLNRSINDKVLLVDGLNLFIRCWNANPMLNEDGLHTGGIAGSLKSLGYAIKLINPTRCIVIFDGDGGSQKRRQIYPEYKQHRKSSVRLNRTYEELSDMETEEANKTKQLVRFAEYLQILPVNILIANGIEADDSIAYCANEYFKSSNVIIMSSDKDFLQLVNDRVKVWSPTKKVMYGSAEILNEYHIHPNNFVLFRAMDGDDSDNINGISGVGIKTVVKYFPFMTEETPRDIKYILDYANANRGKYKIYDSVIEGAQILERNYSLMQLRDSIVSSISQLHINDCLNTNKVPKLDKVLFGKYIREDKMYNNILNHQVWVGEAFRSLIRG